MTITALLIVIYGILILGVVAIFAWYFWLKHRTKTRMLELELQWRRELDMKNIDPADVERIIESRKQTYVLQHPTSRIFWPRE